MNDMIKNMARDNNQKLDIGQIKKDPFIRLGYGMVSYRNLLFALIMLFTVMSIIGGGMMYINSTGNAYTYQSRSKGLSKWTLGNLGYASIKCEIAPFIQKSAFLKCDYGNITQLVNKDHGYGINLSPDQEPAKEYPSFKEPRLCPAHQERPTPEW